jgi:hypothetical protein
MSPVASEALRAADAVDRQRLLATFLELVAVLPGAVRRGDRPDLPDR